mmetsp:Transcript_12211/g.18204  ORF Transcript_12211/g.18204 Transcript_12211/m.18204 type:complete len:388 (-) Transcript_12211:77-1240(-)
MMWQALVLLLLLSLTTAPAVISFAPNLPPPQSSSSLNSATTSHTDSHTTNTRNILILSHNVTQDVAAGYFDVNTLLSGRIDVLSRCVNSALWISNGIRKDTNVYLMLFPHNITIEVRGGSVRGLNPDERTMALCLQRTLLDGGCEHVDNNLYDAADGLKSESVDGNNNVSITNSSSSSMQATIQEERRQLELNNLRKRTLKRPTTYNPNKPGSYTKSERIRMRTVRKQREAMIRRIQRSSKATTTSTAGGDDGDDETSLPTAINAGFLLHRNDSLERRLQLLNGNITFMMDEIGEPLSQFLDDSSRCSIDTTTKTDTTTTTTNIVLGDQMGYAPCDEEFLLEQCDNNDKTTTAVVMKKVSLGPISLLTSQCITIVHNCLDINERALE